jgi:hypothetical protein
MWDWLDPATGSVKLAPASKKLARAEVEGTAMAVAERFVSVAVTMDCRPY